MGSCDLIVVGAGISGASFAFAAAKSGRRTLVVDSASRAGGCLHSHRRADQFWFELGAHTSYNSYRGFIDIIEGCGLQGKLLPRRKVPFRFLVDGRLRSIASQLSFIQILFSLPRGLMSGKQGRSVRDYYARLVGRGNYERLLGPFLAAVPSQRADEFPATMLFKKRPRRKDVMRSYTLEGGLQSVVDAALSQPNVEFRGGTAVRTITRTGEGFELTTESGEQLAAREVGVAVSPAAAAALLQDSFPDLAAPLQRVHMVDIDTVGVVVAAEALRIEPVAGIVPARDIFFSAVSRDTVEHSQWRAFAFHFAPGHTQEERIARIVEVLGVSPDALAEITTTSHRLPSPRTGHEEIVAAIDQASRGSRLRVVGNYFAGLAIEDCVERSNAQLAELLALA